MTTGTKSGGSAEKDKHSAENDKNSAENDEIEVQKKVPKQVATHAWCQGTIPSGSSALLIVFTD